MKVGWHIFLRQIPGIIGREGISVILGIVRASSSSLMWLGIFYLQVGVVQGHRIENIFYLRSGDDRGFRWRSCYYIPGKSLLFGIPSLGKKFDIKSGATFFTFF